VLGFGSSFAGCLFFLVGLIQEIEWCSVAEEPTEIRLADLLARWPQGNHHVVLTDFVCGTPLYITKESSDPPTVWLPVYPTEEVGRGGLGWPRKARMLISFSGPEDQQDEMERQCQRARVQGLVLGSADLGSVGRKLIAKQSPDTDFSACLKLEVGRRPPNRSILFWYIVGGAVTAPLGAVTGIISLCVLAPGWVRMGIAMVRSPFRGGRQRRTQGCAGSVV
jgi:hypothetical protein